PGPRAQSPRPDAPRRSPGFVTSARGGSDTGETIQGEPMERSVFEIVKAPLGWSVFADNVKIGGVYDSRGAALDAAHLAASYTISDGGGVQINVPGAE